MRNGSEREKGRRGGFTLFEVILACLVLSIVVMGAMQYSVQSFRIINDQAKARAALYRARQRIELILAAPANASFWSSLPLDGSYYLFNYNSTNGMFDAAESKTGGTETIDVNTGRWEIWSMVTRKRTRKAADAEKAEFIEIEVYVQYGNRTNENINLRSSRSVSVYN